MDLGEALMWFIVGYAVIGAALGLVALARDFFVQPWREGTAQAVHRDAD